MKTQRTEKLVYNDGTVVFVKRVPRAQLADLREFQDQLLEKFIAANLSFGALMMDDEAYTIMETICGMLPTVSGQPVEFTKIEEDYEQLVRFFCSRSIKDDGSYEKIEPSLLAALHHFDYGGTMGKLFTDYTKKKLAEEEVSESQAAM